MHRHVLLTAWLGLVLIIGTSACRRRDAIGGAAVRASAAALRAAPWEVAPVAAPLASDAASGVPPVAALTPAPSVPRLYVKNRFVFVRPRADINADWVGFLWFGASVALRRAEPVGGPGCAAYYAIEPNGFVCVDGKQATLNADDSEFKAVSNYAPRLDRAAPHQYAESSGTELLAALPGAPRRWPDLPAFFHEPRRRLLPLSTIAYAAEETVDGQDWLLSADLLWLKKAQVSPYPEITFHGVVLGGDWRLPLAFFRQPDKPKYRRNAAGKLEKSGESFALHGVVALGPQIQIQR
ncbi:MAG TPA: hypothetical protein VGL19_13785, partial [Polyangiaceae bacterium]